MTREKMISASVRAASFNFGDHWTLQCRTYWLKYRLANPDDIRIFVDHVREIFARMTAREAGRVA